MLLAGANDQELDQWRLRNIGDYLYTSQSGCFQRRDGVGDDEEYYRLRDAFDASECLRMRRIPPAHTPGGALPNPFRGL